MVLNAEPVDTAGLLRKLKDYASAQNLSNRDLSAKIGIPYNTLRDWPLFTARKETARPSRSSLEKIQIFLLGSEKPELSAEIREATRRVEKIKLILLLLEDELTWFKDASREAREQYRRMLDASDIGYLSSLLTMLTDEDRFDRWRTFTTARFGFFRRK